MKYNVILPLALCLAIVGCEKSEEKIKKEEADKAVVQGQAQLAAMQIENTQRSAVSEALALMSGQKGNAAEYYANEGVCLSSNRETKTRDFVNNLSKAVLQGANYIDTFTFNDDCTISVTFKDSESIPDLKRETLALKMTVDNEKGVFIWSCSFTGKNQKDVPSACKDK